MNAIVDSSARTTTPKRARAGTKSTRSKSRTISTHDVAALNEQPVNQHAFKLLPKWTLKPDDTQLHLLTLASAAQFAGKADAGMLRKMRDEWAPSAVMEHFSRVDTFEDLFLAQDRPLEAAQVALAAVNIVAEPQRYLSAFRLQ